MLINTENLINLFSGYKTVFNTGFQGVTPVYKSIATIVPSSTREETYGWLGQFPKMREWAGDRIIKGLAAQSYKIKNRDFEQTISVGRNDVQDDQYGLLSPMFGEMGRSAAEFPDELCMELLAAGFTTECYDGEYFFDTDHPVGGNGADLPATTVSNFQGGSGSPWFLLDCSRPLKPLIFQERMPLGNLVRKDQPTDDNVFMRKEFIYGSDGRCNVGFGLWQMAFASKEDLTAANYEAARAAMSALKGDAGRPLGIKPDTLVVGPSLEGAALRLLNNGSRVETVGNTSVAVQNEWAKTAALIVTPWLT